MPSGACGNDWSIAVSDCRSFDFTLAFEFYVLSLVPSLIFIVGGIAALPRLLKGPRLLPTFKKSSTGARHLLLAKLGINGALVSTSLAALVTWTRDGNSLDVQGISGVVTLVFSLTSSLVVLILSWAEHHHAWRSSFLLPFYLLATIFCDVARVRTFADIGFVTEGGGRFFGAFAASLGARFLALLVEDIEKGFIFEELGLKDISTETTASFFSRLLFSWNLPLLLCGARNQLTLASLPSLDPELSSLSLYESGITQFAREVKRGSNQPLLWTFIRAFPVAVLAPMAPCIVCSLALIAQPLMINQMVTFIGSYSTATPQPAVHGWSLSAAFLLVGLIYTFSQGFWNLALNRGATKLRSFMLEAIYRKATRVHVEVTNSVGVGKASNLMSVDTERILGRIQNVYELINAIITVAFGFLILYREIGVAFVACIIAVAVVVVATPYCAANLGPLQGARSAATDSRNRLTSSLLRQFRGVKLSALERPLGRKILAARETELRALRKFWIQLTWVATLTNLQSLLTIGTYAVITIYDSSAPLLTSARLFTTVAVLNLIASPLLNLGQSWGNIVAAFASIKRIEAFLLEREAPPRQTPAANDSLDLVFSRASFGVKDKVLLKDISTIVRQGQRTFIVGRVASGKSTFLAAALGEIDVVAGECCRPSSRTAYCSQDAWLREDSIKSVIVFISDFEADWYAEVLRAVALDVDLQILSLGDACLASDLSGGQKQRVALARAIYARPERLVLDDVFSALDASTADHILGALFNLSTGLLKGRTVLLATNDVRILRFSDHIIMLADGRVAEQGSYAELIASTGPTARLVEEFASEERLALKSFSKMHKEQNPASVALEDPGEDEGGRGGIKHGAYGAYGKAVSAGNLAVYTFFVLVSGSTTVVTQVYLSFWSAAMDKNARAGLTRYLGGYVGLELVSVVIFCLCAPSGIIEALGAGKVLNRFNSDMDMIDDDLASALLNLTGNTAGIVGTAIIIVVAAPYVGIVIAGSVVVFFFIQRFYTRSSQQLRRLDLGSRTPLYSLINDTVTADGIMTVRAFGGADHFVQQNTLRTNRSQKPYYLMNVSRRWLNTALNICATGIGAALALVATASRHSTSAGIFAVALVQSISLLRVLNHIFVSWVETEICMTSVERCEQFAKLAPEDDPTQPPPTSEKELDLVWPQQGEIVFSNVSAKYRSDLPPALRGFSVKIPAGRRVGICGRSGSGKSTILATLFRQLDVEGGDILVDGMNISSISRAKVRGGMSIVPQDPLLLDASVRENLDVAGERSDEEIWEALDSCSLKATIEALPLRLDANVSDTFSRGQRQLLALARALLQRRSILCLDEATSSLDAETDQAIQKTLRTAFKKATIVTVAHRLGSIMDFDQVLVMSEGSLVEHGSPAELLAIPGGYFRKLVKGEETALEVEQQTAATITAA